MAIRTMVFVSALKMKMKEDEMMVDRHMILIQDVLNALTKDMVDVCKYVGVETTEEDLLNAYFCVAEGPSALEDVLIKEGRYTEDELVVNIPIKIMFNRLAELTQTKVGVRNGE